MLSDIIYEQKGKISGYRVLDTEGPTIETTITGTGIINGIEVTDIVTYWSKPASQSSLEDNEKAFNAEGQGGYFNERWRNGNMERIWNRTL
jgi:hypothetical protein